MKKYLQMISAVENMTKLSNKLNNDLTKISTWAFQWKTNFNPDLAKQVQEVIFSRKLQNNNHPCLIFNHSTVSFIESQKHLGIVLDSRLDFKEHLGIIFKKVSKARGLLSPRKSLITLYKSFIRPHMDYAIVISFMTKPVTLLFIVN